MQKPDKIILYGSPVCPQVPPIKYMLNNAKAEYEYVDIHQDRQGMLTVQELNDGNASVPTLVFPDGTTLTEPSGRALQKKLSKMGYSVSPVALMLNYWQWLVIGAGALLALLAAMGVI